jgi:hypothetical protein
MPKLDRYMRDECKMRGVVWLAKVTIGFGRQGSTPVSRSREWPGPGLKKYFVPPKRVHLSIGSATAAKMSREEDLPLLQGARAVAL